MAGTIKRRLNFSTAQPLPSAPCWICKTPLSVQAPADKSRDAQQPLKSSDIIESARAGCAFCQRIWHAITTYSPPSSDMNEFFVFIPRPRTPTATRKKAQIANHDFITVTLVPALYMSIQIYFPKVGIRESILQSLSASRQLPVFDIAPPISFCKLDEIPDTAGSQRTFSFIHGQINRCLSEHADCRWEKPEPSSLPKRLLRIRKRRSGAFVSLITSSSADVAKYAAMSYCWGNAETSPPLRTLRSNVEQMMENIELAAMPSTLRDAITVCTRLGLKYIWIDSLCIVQDDSRDWEAEAPRMCEIYQNAFITIIAASTSSCHESFMQTERVKPITLAKVKMDGKLSSLRARKYMACGHHLRRDINLGLDSEDSRVDPIDARAWTLQERALSTRAIVFTAQEVQWECKSEKVCECGLEMESTLKDAIEGRGTMSDIHPSAVKKWDMVVEDYSRRQLTKLQDRLPALSGLAKRLSRDLGSEYVAGIWRHHLIHGLCWRRAVVAPLTRENIDEYRFQENYIAPTFSWASVLGQIRVDSPGNSTEYTTVRWLATLVDVECIAATADPFGKVVQARIDINCPVFDATMEHSEKSGFELHVPNLPYRDKSTSAKIDSPLQKAAFPSTSDVTFQRLRRTADIDKQLYFGDGRVLFAPLFLWDYGMAAKLWGLVLVPRGSSGAYERIGCVSFSVVSKEEGESYGVDFILNSKNSIRIL